MICDLCKNITTDGQPGTHHSTYDSFKRSVDLGCYLCSRLWAALRPNERRNLSALVESETNRSSDATEFSANGLLPKNLPNGITATSLIEFSQPSHGKYELSLEISTSVVSHPAWTAPSPFDSRVHLWLRPLDATRPSEVGGRCPESTKSAQTMCLARNWIEECVANHPRCKTFAGTQGWYPTRLLDCGPIGDTEPCCRLINTDAVFPSGPYMTLSHCWGNTECLKLTTVNSEQLFHTIPSSLLPKLYRDAVWITRYMGVRYLWIDSLCIIQEGDDLTDWLREVKVMGKIYSNSYCNISAASATGGDNTLFCSRNADSLGPQIMDLTVNDRTSPFLVIDFRMWEFEVTRALINTRGWVLQERLLSPRVLHFGERQILWECRQKDAAEIYPDGLPLDPPINLPFLRSTQNFQQPPTRFKSLAPGRFTTNDQTDNNLVAYCYWADIVYAYTLCELSFPIDKLVALSAIAKVMRENLRDEYVAGMWRRYLEFELLWSRSRSNSEDTSRPENYRAPSWSWAAVDGVVDPGSLDVEAMTLLIEVVSLELEYATDDNTGLVQGGWLQLRGALKPLKLLRHLSSNSCSYGDWDMLVNGLHVSSVRSDTELTAPHPDVMLDAVHDHFEAENANGALYCMPGTVRSGDNVSIQVLLLEVVDSERGVYRRIGLACGWNEEVKEKILASSGMEETFPCEEYREGFHLIRII